MVAWSINTYQGTNTAGGGEQGELQEWECAWGAGGGGSVCFRLFCLVARLFIYTPESDEKSETNLKNCNPMKTVPHVRLYTGIQGILFCEKTAGVGVMQLARDEHSTLELIFERKPG